MLHPRKSNELIPTNLPCLKGPVTGFPRLPSFWGSSPGFSERGSVTFTGGSNFYGFPTVSTAPWSPTVLASTRLRSEWPGSQTGGRCGETKNGEMKYGWESKGPKPPMKSGHISIPSGCLLGSKKHYFSNYTCECPQCSVLGLVAEPFKKSINQSTQRSPGVQNELVG